MEFNYSKLRGRIIEVYGTAGKFADAMGFTHNTMSEKLNNKTQFSTAQIRKACELLGIDNDEIGVYFFTPKVQETEQNEVG